MTLPSAPADPFYDGEEPALVETLASATAFLEDVGEPDGEAALDAASRSILARLGAVGVLGNAAPAPGRPFSLRRLVATREVLGYRSSLADTLLAVQGLCAHPIQLGGGEAQKAAWLPRLASGEISGAFALTEPEAGSDLSGVATRATRDGASYRLSGRKAHISNAGFADVYCVLARTGDEGAARPFSMFLVRADARGLTFRRTALLAPHPFGDIGFDGVAAELIGDEGDGLRLALGTLDAFRPSVGAAAVGMARRATDEAVAHARKRKQFGTALAEFQAVQMAIAESETDIDAARLLVRRAAWLKDTRGARITREGGMAKLFATEMAQRAIDRSVQIHGAAGVLRGSVPERLYREIRSLRIYEGASDIQKIVIARSTLDAPKR